MYRENKKYNPDLVERARLLRKAMTYEERKLWYLFLYRHYVKWYRQRVMGNFILDFYCAKAHLAIEIDGGQHYTKQGIAYDEERSQYLLKFEVNVVRYSNDDIKKRFDEVCKDIDRKVKKLIADPLRSEAASVPLE